MPDFHSMARRRDARPHVGRAIHVHQAVRAPAGEAQQPARAMVLEAAAEDPLARAIQRRCHGVSVAPVNRPSVEMENHRLEPGKKVSSTSFDRVSLTA